MGINWGAAAAGYQGFKEEQRRTDDDARRAKADERAEKDAAFQEEARSRQRYDWSEVDRIRAADKADRQAVNADSVARANIDQGAAEQGAAEAAVENDKLKADVHAAVFNSDIPDDTPVLPTFKQPSPFTPKAAPAPSGAEQYAAAAPPGADSGTVQIAPAKTSPKIAPEVVAKMQELRAGGIPQPRNFNDSLTNQAELIRRKMARGDMTTEDYAKQSATLSALRKEGVHDALDAFASGDYEGGIAAFNNVGKNNGARIVKGEEGTTLINGQSTPTHFVTIANADGSRSVMDVAKARYQLMDLNTQLQHQDKAANTKMTADYHAGTLALGEKQLAQSAKDAEAGRAIQRAQLSIAQQQAAASTPAGQFAAMEKALGRPLTADEKASQLKIDTLAPATRLRLTGLIKEQEQIAQAMSKAQAEGSWQPDSVGGRELLRRSARLNGQISDALTDAGQGRAKADPGHVYGAPAGSRAPAAGATVPNPFAPGGQAPAAPAQKPAIVAPAGGVRQPPAQSGEKPTYEGWLGAKKRLEEVQETAAAMSPDRRWEYLGARLPDLEAAVKYHAEYPKY